MQPEIFWDYDDQVISRINVFIDFIKGALKVDNFNSIADIGCGNKYIGTQLGAKDFYDKEPIDDTVQFIDLQSNNFIDRQYDFIVSSHVLEHMPNPLLAMKHIKHMLYKGGYIALAVPDASDTTNCDDGFKAFSPDFGHVSYFDEAIMYNFLRYCGFDVTRLKTHGHPIHLASVRLQNEVFAIARKVTP